MKISRREFVGLGLAAGTSAAAGCRPVIVTQALGRADTGKRPTGPVTWIHSACLQCSGGCGIRVKTIAGNAVKIEGNAKHPVNRGRLCPKGQAGLQALYDPDRIQGPMRRTGQRGAGLWESVSWEKAIVEVADRLAKIRRENGPHTVAILGERYRGHMEQMFHRFAQSYGTPNELGGGPAKGTLGIYFTQGIRGGLGYDWEHTNYVLSFGASLIESFQPTVLFQRMVAHLRRGHPGMRGKLVTIDPRCSVTASKSDEWIPIRPGTDGALAEAMAAVIVRSGLHDKAFIKEHTAGFDEWKKSVLDGVRLESAAAETGIPAATIERLAKEFAQRRPSIAVAGGGAGEHTNGLYNLMAVHCLNALVGSLDAPGGLIVQEHPPFSAWPEVKPDDVARRGLSMPRIDGAGTSRFPLAESVASTFAEATLDGAQDKLRAALIYYANPLFSCADPARTRQALESIPFVVSFSPFMDDTTALADLVLPDHTYLEELQLDEPPAGTGFAALALRQPAVRPLYDTRSTGDVLIQIARAMGGPVGEAFPWPNYEKAARATLAGVAKAASMSPDKLWKTLQEEGVWSAGPYKFGDPKRTYQTPSGKFEFVSSLMKRKLEAIAGAKGTGVDGMAVDMGIAARGEKVFMPHYEKPIIDEDERFPLHLNCYKTMTHAEGRGGNQPWLQESYGVQLGEFWGPWVEINPETAHKLHIHDGEVVWLESEAGRIKVTARFFEGAMPDVVNVPFEYGHTAGGRWEARRGANPNQLSKVKHDPLCGTVSRSATRVRINRGMA